jgi:hypothetical protein
LGKMPRSILAPFRKSSAEGATVGRLLAGYSNIEVGLMHCVQWAQDGNLDKALKGMFLHRGETPRIHAAEQLGHAHYQLYGLAADFRKAIRVVHYCLKIRNQYAHWVWWDDYSGKLAFANLEDLAKRKRPVRDLQKLHAHHVDATLLERQEAYFVYADEYIAWINYEGRLRAGKLKVQPLLKPKPMKRPKLRL